METIATKIYFGASGGPVPLLDTTGKGQANAASLTFSHTVAAQNNRALLVGVTTRNNVAVSSVTYNGDALTLEEVITESGLDTRLEVWYRLQPDTGANNVVVTLASAEDVAAISIGYYNVDQDTPFRDVVESSGT